MLKKLLDSYSFLDASLDILSSTLSSFPFLAAKRMEDGLFKTTLPYPYEKDQTIESFYQPLKFGRGDYFFYFETIISKFRRDYKKTS